MAPTFSRWNRVPPASPVRHALPPRPPPPRSRPQITHRDTINDIGELGAAMYVKGRYFPPGTRIPQGERKLYLEIQGGLGG